MKSRLPFFLLILLPLVASAQLSREDFAARFMDVVRESSPQVSIEKSGPLHLKATGPQGAEHEVYLDNAYDLYLQDNEALEEVLDLYAAALLEGMARDDSGISMSDIVPVVKDVGWLEEVAEFADGRDVPEYMQRPLADGLLVIYAEDTPSNIRYIGKRSIEEAGIDAASIDALSVRNLLNKLPEVEVLGADGLYMITAGGNYEASLLLVDEIWSGSNFDVEGDIVVSVPSRDVLLVSGSEETERLEELIDLAKSIHAESPYFITTTLYVRRDNRWQPL